MVLALIATGESNPDHEDKNGGSALTYAEANHLEDVVRLLSSPEYSIDVNRECFDVGNAKHCPVREFLNREKGNMVFMMLSKRRDGKYIPSDTAPLIGTNIRRLTVDGRNIVYACREENTLRPENIIRTPVYYDFKNANGFGDLVEDAQVQKIVSNASFINPLFAVVETNVRLLTTVGAAALDQRNPDGISRRHCQSRQSATVYKLYPCVPTASELEAGTDAGAIINAAPVKELTPSDYKDVVDAAVKEAGRLRFLIGEKKVEVPLHLTIGEVKRRLLEQEGIPATSSVRFIYKGKVLTDAMHTSEIVAGDVVLAQVRMAGGRRTKKRGRSRSKRSNMQTRTKGFVDERLKK